MLMKIKVFAFLICFFIGTRAQAITLPVINNGDLFTGSFSINPSAPLTGIAVGPPIPTYVYETAGTMTVSVDGFIFSSAINVFVTPQNEWFSFSFGALAIN